MRLCFLSLGMSCWDRGETDTAIPFLSLHHHTWQARAVASDQHEACAFQREQQVSPPLRLTLPAPEHAALAQNRRTLLNCTAASSARCCQCHCTCDHCIYSSSTSSTSSKAATHPRRRSYQPLCARHRHGSGAPSIFMGSPSPWILSRLSIRSLSLWNSFLLLLLPRICLPSL